MTLRRVKAVFMAGSFFMLSCGAAFAADIKLSSGGAFIDSVVKPHKDQFEKVTGHKLIAVEKGFKFGVAALEKGEVDVLGGSFTPDDFPKMIKKESVEVKDISIFQHVVLGEDKIIIATHKNNPVSRLTKEQLKGIFTGKINNWKEVGGTDGEVIVVWTKFLQAPNEAFIKKMLDGEPVTKDLLEVNMLGDAKNNVKTTPQAIMMYPTAVQDPNLKFPEVPAVSRPTIMLTKGPASPAVKSLIDYIKAEYAKQK